MDKERKIRSENLASPDQSQFLLVDPDDLMRDNPAALIVNRDSYEGMQAHFSEKRFLNSPPEVARVKIYIPIGEAERLFVVDGLTRTKFASDHKGKILKEAPNMRFDNIRVIDITSEILQDPRVVPTQEHQKDQQALTILQYLRAVVPPTIVHSEIATDRIAGHLINTWKGMIGSDLAAKFPALSAISFLANERIPIAPTKELQKVLARQEQLVTNEQAEERSRLDKALCDMAAIIQQSKLARMDLEKSAYFLVGSGSSVIGGSKEMKEQIFGLLRSYAFEKKLNREYPHHQLAEAAHIRHEFILALEETFRKLSNGTHDGEKALVDVKRALDDTSLTITQTLRIIKSSSPAKEYSEVIKDANKQSLKEQYLATVRKKELTDTETVLIDNLGGQTYLLGSRIPSMVTEIQFCVAILRQSKDWQDQLRKDVDDFVQQGVQESTINETISQMSQKQNALMSSDSLQALSSRAKQLQNVIVDFKARLADEKLKHCVSEVVTRVFGQDLQTDQDPHLKERIVWAARHDTNIDASSSRDLLRWVKGLKSLDPDLRTEVVSGNITRIATAMRIQAQRRIINVTPENKPDDVISVIPRNQMDVSTRIPVQPKPTELQPQVSPDKIKQGRIEMNIRRLSEEIIKPHLIPAIRLLAILDLDPQDIPSHLKEILGEAEIAIEKLRGGHPDVIRVMDEDYDKLQKEVTRLRGVILDIQRQQADRDTYSNPNS